jgi:hypothetical protein
MRKTLLSIPTLLLCFIPALARADSIATVDVSGSFVPSSDFGLVGVFGSGASLFVTGQFTLDENTNTVSSWNMTFLGTGGATYQLSPQDGGVATVQCTSTPCTPFWILRFSNSNAFLQMDVLFSSSPLFQAGESLLLCPVQFTMYPDGNIVSSPPCNVTSGASFDNQSGVVYTLPDGVTTSGFLTVVSVVSTPEPSESTTLLLGIAIAFGSIVFQKTQRRHSNGESRYHG